MHIYVIKENVKMKGRKEEQEGGRAEGGKKAERQAVRLASRHWDVVFDSLYFILADAIVWSVLHKNSEEGEKLPLLHVTRDGFWPLTGLAM